MTGSIVSLCVALLTACGGAAPDGDRRLVSDPPVRSPRIVASIAPLASLARRVCGPGCDVATLVPPGASAHTWEPSPRDAERLARVDIFFIVGLGYEAWLGKVVGGGGSTYETVDGSEGIDFLFDAESLSATAAPEARAAGAAGAASAVGRAGEPAAGVPRSAAFANPHYWLDPVAMKSAVRRLAEALGRKDPVRAKEYAARAEQTEEELDALDAEIRDRISKFTIRKLIAFHPAWGYFARRYGLSVLGAIEESPGREPGIREVEEIVRLVRTSGLRAVFAEPQFPAKAAEAIAAECGVKVLILDPVGGEGIPGRADYFSLLRHDVRVMEEAML